MVVSRTKRIAFWSVMVASPLLLLAAVEIILRLAGYGGDTELILRKMIGGRECFVVNRHAASRYFAGWGGVVPEPHDDAFAVEKAPGTRRIFCLGESTMEGFPFEFNATAPSFLADRLRTLYPGARIEVINLGLSAVGSFVVRDLVRELLRYRPDLFVIYLGHNEFYGVYGPASAVVVRGPPWLTGLSIALLRFKTYLLLRDAYIRVARRLRPGAVQEGATLMEEMVGEDRIPYRGDLYARTLADYAANLNGIIDDARGAGVPLMFSGLVSNLRDQPPFTGTFAPGTSAERKVAWEHAVAAGDSALLNGEPGAAAAAFDAATAIDSTNADGWYGLGQALYRSGQFIDARAAFVRARDEDALRFRATGEFQDTLLAVCRERGVPVSRVDAAFDAASPHGITGHELILEHLHPTIAGYFLMAKTWSSDIAERGLLGPEPPGGRVLPDSAYMDISAVSAFDSALGTIKVRLIVSRPPFTRGRAPQPFIPTDSVQAIVYAYVRHRIAWSDARYALADYYARRARFALARRECQAVWRVIPYSFQPLLKAADYFADEGDTGGARVAYERCIAIQDNPFARMKLGLQLLQGNHADGAAQQFESGFSVDGKSAGTLSADGAASGRYLLGVAYARLGRYGEARQNLQRALAIRPNMREARDVLAQIPP